MQLHQPRLFINDPQMIQEIYTTYGQLYDKDPTFHILTFPILGNATVFERTTDWWN
jgi:hypothetical protein